MSDWVFLRGLAREARHWEGLPALFRRRLSDQRVFCPDLPGSGCRRGVPCPADVDRIFEDVRAQLSNLGARPPYRLLGQSLGGMVCLAWARRHPDEVEGVVLLNSSVGGLSPFHQRLRMRNYPALLRILHAADPEARERAILELTSQRHPPELAQRWARYARETPMAAADVLRQLLAAARFRAPSALGVPGLVLYGAGDRLVAPDCSRRIAAHYGWPALGHPAAGHDLALDAPDWLLETVSTWLDGQASLQGVPRAHGQPRAAAQGIAE